MAHDEAKRGRGTVGLEVATVYNLSHLTRDSYFLTQFLNQWTCGGNIKLEGESVREI